MEDFIVNMVFESENESFLNDELRAVKSALLFADKVSISSGSLSIGLSLYKTFGADAMSQLSVPERSFTEAKRKLAQSEDEMLSASIESKTIKLSKKDFSLEIINLLQHFISNADENYLYRINELNSLIDKGLVVYSGKYYNLTQTVEPMQVVEDHLGSIISGLTYPSTFNMFNKGLGEFLHYLYQQHGYTSPQIRDLKYTRLIGNLLADIPNIGEAKVDEILDIRKALAKPLIKFRSAIFDFSDQIASAPWDNDFEIECRQLYHQKLAPVLSEIAQCIEDNCIPKNIISSVRGSIADIIGAAVSRDIAGVIGKLLESVVEGFSPSKRKLAKENSFCFLYEVQKKFV